MMPKGATERERLARAGRVKITVNVPQETMEALDEIVKATDYYRSAIIRQAISEWIERNQ
jgi:predicted transcriptional regulator